MELFGYKIEKLKREKIIYFGKPKGYWEYALGEGKWEFSETLELTTDISIHHQHMCEILKQKIEVNNDELQVIVFEIMKYLYSDKYAFKIVTENI